MKVKDAKRKLCPLAKEYCEAKNCMFWAETNGKNGICLVRDRLMEGI